MSVYGGKCLQHPPLSYTQEELDNIKCIKMLGPQKLRPQVTLYNTKTQTMLKKTKWGKEGKPSGKKPPSSWTLKVVGSPWLTHPQQWMKVSELLLWKYLGEYVCNLLIIRVVLQNDSPVMH